MKKYHIDYTSAAQKAIDKLDKSVSKRITDWIRDNLEDCENPRLHGTNLINHPKGNWRYRVGNYRILAQIQDDKVIILVVDVDKRNDVYKK